MSGCHQGKKKEKGNNNLGNVDGLAVASREAHPVPGHSATVSTTNQHDNASGRDNSVAHLGSLLADQIPPPPALLPSECTIGPSQIPIQFGPPPQSVQNVWHVGEDGGGGAQCALPGRRPLGRRLALASLCALSSLFLLPPFSPVPPPSCLPSLAPLAGIVSALCAVALWRLGLYAPFLPLTSLALQFTGAPSCHFDPLQRMVLQTHGMLLLPRSFGVAGTLIGAHVHCMLRGHMTRPDWNLFCFGSAYMSESPKTDRHWTPSLAICASRA